MLGYLIFGLIAVVVGLVLFSPWLKGFRTQTAAGLTAAIGGVFPLLADAWVAVLPYSYDVVSYLKDLDWREYMDADKAPYIMIGLGVAFYILRRITDTRIGEKV